MPPRTTSHLPLDVEHALRRSLKGFTTGYLLSAGPPTLSICLQNIFRPSKLVKQLWKLHIKQNGKHLPWGLWLASMAGGFYMLDEVILPKVFKEIKRIKGTAENGEEEGEWWCTPLFRSFVAGTIASTSLAFIPPRLRTDIAIVAFVRAVDSYICHIAKESPELFDGVPSWMKNHVDTILFTLSCWEIMFAWFYTPQSLPSTYVRWITRMSELDTSLVTILRYIRAGDIVYGKTPGYEWVLQRYCQSRGIPSEMGDPGLGFIECSVLHPQSGASCTHNVWTRWHRGFSKAIKIYLIVHLAPLLFRNPSKKTLTRLPRSILHALRSSAFLATFIALVWAGICIGRRSTRNDLAFHGPFLGSFLCGMSVLIESKKRRMEMALYCLPRAIYSVIARSGGMGQLKKVEMTVGAVCMGWLLACVKRDKKSVRDTVRWLVERTVM